MPDTDWGKVVGLLLGAAAVGGGLYLILKPEPEPGVAVIESQVWTKGVAMLQPNILKQAEIIKANYQQGQASLRPKSQLWVAAKIGALVPGAPSYARGETTTVQVTVKSLSDFSFTCYARAWLDWQAWGVWQMDDPNRRTWIQFNLAPNETKTLTGYTYIGLDEPYGERVGRVILYAEQDPQSRVLDQKELVGAAQVIGVGLARIEAQKWL